jgi:hypothetical protein
MAKMKGAELKFNDVWRFKVPDRLSRCKWYCVSCVFLICCMFARIHMRRVHSLCLAVIVPVALGRRRIGVPLC